MEIIVDTREPIEINESIRTQCDELYMKHGINVKVTQKKMDTGDFAIVAGEPVAYIERKTWADLSASIKDNRCETQWERLNALASAGYAVYWLIEGTIPPVSGSDYGIPNTSLHSKLAHMAAVGNRIVYTRCINHTAYTLVHMARYFSVTGGESQTVTSRFVHSIRIPSEVNAGLRQELAALLNKHKQSPDTPESTEFDPRPTVKLMWQSLLGKSKVVDSVIGRYSIREVLNNPDIVDEFRYNSGKKLNNRESIKGYIRSDLAVQGLVEAVHGVSRDLASFIWQQLGTEKMRTLKEPEKMVRNGRTVSKNILPRYILCLDYKIYENCQLQQQDTPTVEPPEECEGVHVADG